MDTGKKIMIAAGIFGGIILISTGYYLIAKDTSNTLLVLTGIAYEIWGTWCVLLSIDPLVTGRRPRMTGEKT